MKMTYFNNLNHQYNRVIFEFTDTEKKDAGFHQTSKEPAILEILRLLNRIYENGIEGKPDYNAVYPPLGYQTEGFPGKHEKPKPPKVQYVREGEDPRKSRKNHRKNKNEK